MAMRTKQSHATGEDLGLVDYGEFTTGSPVRFRFARNTERAPDFGARFGQDIEPAGRYILHDDFGAFNQPLRGWEYGWAEFESPLVLSFNTQPDEQAATLYGPSGWKARLSRHYGGKRGVALTRALRKDGFDGIVTVWVQSGRASGTREIVDLRLVRNPSSGEIWVAVWQEGGGWWYELFTDPGHVVLHRSGPWPSKARALTLADRDAEGWARKPNKRRRA